MRDVTREIVNAFLAREYRCIKHDRTDGLGLWLHSNMIAWRGVQIGEWVNGLPVRGSEADDTIHMTLAGWNTITTRERLNGLCERLMGKRPFHCIKFTPHFNGVPISADDVLTWYPGITDAGQMLAVNMMIKPSHRDAA